MLTKYPSQQALSRGLLSTQEAADWLTISPRKLQQMKKDGEISFVQFGRTVGYTIEDLKVFLSKQRTAAIS
ncbi:helix-turn-helix domain-containing protein [Calycomorphotria hydatis]|uniref:Helix-turn-helix domain protein n=1 Tax=Calycomorphotria hydatis TaxID=2528027 RepID=A0A517TDL1_9PLAN|nr:helix-turn-helix domain-containing protein [Calycomorphotria hydatis]QDT66470.1 hypothetical protein V22_37380 [Calycomorphotria hydatis]